MKLLHKFSIVGCLLLLLSSCKKEDDLNLQQPVGLGGDVTAPSAIDKWLKDSLTTPYNIEVKYRWDPWELNLSKTLTPPDENKIIPAMSAIKRVFIDPYNAETGSQLFMKKYAPKQFILVGSVEYFVNGSVVLGQAEGGNNITFFDVNQNYWGDNATSVKEMLHTAQHEFGHILHQNILYPQEYQSISVDKGLPGFTATWFNVSNKQALEWGYITPYSMNNANDDFVEMISIMLMEGRSKFNDLVFSVSSPAAREALQEKERAVVDYYQRVYNINFYSLQNRVQAALKAVVPPPPVPAVDALYGFGKIYTKASVDPNNTLLLPQPAAFTSIYNSSRNGVAALGITMDSMALLQPQAGRAVLRLYLGQGGAVFFADYTFTATKGANNLYTYTYLGANGNGNIVSTAVTPLLNYFRNNQFAITWYADPVASNYPRIQFTPQATPGTFFIARLLP